MPTIRRATVTCPTLPSKRPIPRSAGTSVNGVRVAARLTLGEIQFRRSAAVLLHERINRWSARDGAVDADRTDRHRGVTIQTLAMETATECHRVWLPSAGT